MKHLVYSIGLILLLTLLAGCQRQTEKDFIAKVELPQRVITATIEGGEGTRTVMSDPKNGIYYPYWKSSDEVAIYADGVNRADKFTLESGAGTDKARFVGPDTGNRLVGLYPYSCITEEGLSNQVLTLELPTIQHHAEGSFGDGSYPMLAVGQSSELTFLNLCSVLHLSVKGSESVESIRFIAHDTQISVSGKATVRTDFNTVPELVMKVGGSPMVTLQCYGVSLNPYTATDFYVVIPAGTYDGGFDLEVLTESGKMTRSIHTDVSFERSQYRSIPTFMFKSDTEQISVPETVNLGLPSGLLWASFNLGASKPEEYGDYYAWGETEPYYYSLDPLIWKDGKEAGYIFSSYKWCMGGYNTLTKYCWNSSYGYNGYVDEKTVLDPEDDAAYVKLGDKWRMPTNAEWQELMEYCDWTWTTQNGVSGLLLTSKVTGFTDRQLFFPAVGSRSYTSLNAAGSQGNYWSSSLYSSGPFSVDDSFHAWDVILYTSGISSGTTYRCYGHSIRPVYDDTSIPESRNCIYYTSTDGDVVTPSAEDVFGANIVSNTYSNGRGVISFDGPVTMIGEKAFFQCDRLQSISIPEGCMTIEYDALYENKSLISIHLPSTIKTIAGYSIYGCESLREINLPEGLTNIGDWAFCGCTSLEEITIPQSVTTMGGAFASCVNLARFKGKFADASGKYLSDGVSLMGFAPFGMTSFTVPDGIKYILSGVFCGFGNLTEILLPEGLLRIGFQSFRDCTGLTEIVIPESVVYIGNTAFQSCQNLTSIQCLPTTPPTGSFGMFSGTGDCPIYVPASSVNTYKSADYWNEYSHRIRALGNETIPVPEMIDMGVSVMWASFNLGASKPEGFGYHLAWGEIEEKELYEWETYRWCAGSKNTLTKYNHVPEYGFNGFTDNKMELDPGDDAAHMMLGGEWRIPTRNEWIELWSNCEWTWETINGVNGYMARSKINGNSIFFPAAGYGPYSAHPGAEGVAASYWANSIVDFEPYSAYSFYFDKDRKPQAENDYDARCNRYSIRPVYGIPAPPVPVESVTLNLSEMDLCIGETRSLSANILPANATNKSIHWTSEDKSIATVSSSGQVTGVAVGSVTIHALAISLEGDEPKSAYCKVTVKEAETNVSAVDLGLSVKWASCNLGASKPEEYGDYYAWGETEPYYSSQDPLTWKEGKEAGYDWPSYKWCIGGAPDAMTKYCSNSSYGYNGFTDNKTVLDSEDDAACIALGSKWRMPTDAEFTELRDCCTWQSTLMNGIKGMKVTGPNGNSIFLPAAGDWGFTSHDNTVSWGMYLSSSLHVSNPHYAWGVSSGSSRVSREQFGRFGGFSIRPVYVE